MTLLKIDNQRCRGCKRCIRSCPANALAMAGDQAIAVVDANLCTLCGLCVSSCPFQAISVARDQDAGLQPADCQGIWIFAEQQAGHVLPVAFELLGKARELAIDRHCSVTALFFGSGTGANTADWAAHATGLIAAGADEVLVCDHPSLADPLDDPYTDLIVAQVRQRQPEILLIGATDFGRSLAPRIAARLRTGLTADCTHLAIDAASGLLRQTRPAFGGNLMATIVTERHRPQMATVRPGVLPAAESDPARTGRIIEIEPPAFGSRITLLARELAAHQASLTDASIIVSAGRGIGSSKNLALVKKLAELLGGDYGVSRPLVDMGWSDGSHQIGQTGLSVAPKLLIACGISGAIQHLAGIGSAETIIAINADPEAPIFSVADYQVVGDCVTILKKLIAELESAVNNPGHSQGA